MLEKRLAAVPAQLFTADGTANGTITIAADACSLFKVKQKVTISATSLPILEIEIKEIANGLISVGPFSSPGHPATITSRSNLSAYTVAANATISANEQKRPAIDYAEAMRAVYDEEPTVALRSILVDECGDKYNAANPLPVAVDGTINISDIRITAADNDPKPGDLHSSVRISDGTNDLDVNTDGSINVNVVSSPSSSPGLMVTHQEISSVVAGVETTMITYTAPTNGFKLYKVELSGENIALFRVKVDGTSVATKRTFFGNLNEDISFEPYTNGLEINSGSILTITVLHTRPFTANFEVTIMGLNL